MTTISTFTALNLLNSGDDFVEFGNGDNDIKGGRGNDYIETGNGDNDIKGGRGNDELFTGNGDNDIEGGRGNDYIETGNGDDNIKGGRGNDEIVPGVGNNLLTGGKGSDVFILDDGGNNTITDFERGIDKIGLGNGISDFNDLTLNGNQIFGPGGNLIATLKGVDATKLTANDFIDYIDVGE